MLLDQRAGDLRQVAYHLLGAKAARWDEIRLEADEVQPLVSRNPGSERKVIDHPAF
jgi:hypothetical protein